MMLKPAVAPSACFSRKRKLAPLLQGKPWKLLKLRWMIVISACTLWTLYKREFSVAFAKCPTYGSAIYPEESEIGFSNPLLQKTGPPLPVNGEYCSKCREDGLKNTAEKPASRPEQQYKHQITNNSNHGSCRGPNSTETLPELQRIKLFQSRKPRPEQAVTIVTQLSLERLHMLQHQCNLCPQPIAAALYIPLVQGKIFSAEEGSIWDGAPLGEALAALAAVHAAAENSTEKVTCILDLDVVVEEVCTPQKALLDYPVNALRNRALFLASTELVLLLDVDFIVDQNLALSTTKDPILYSDLVDILSQGAAMVLPAFETADEGDAGIDLAITAVQRGKPYLVPRLQNNAAFPFHGCVYPAGQRATQSLYWLKNSTTKPYRIFYEESFEPYLLMKKSFVPYYDERFTGRHRNKMQHIMHIAVQSDLALVVHPFHFVIHLPHQKSFARQHQDDGNSEFNGVQHKHTMEAYYQEAILKMEKQQFLPVTSFSYLCLPGNDKGFQPAKAVEAREEMNRFGRLPEFLDYNQDGVGEYWDCFY